MGDSMVTSSNHMLQTIDSTNMSYQTDSEPEPYAVFDQTDYSHAGTTSSTNPEYPNRDTFEQTIETQPMATSSNN